MTLGVGVASLVTLSRSLSLTWMTFNYEQKFCRLQGQFCGGLILGPK